MSSHLVIAGTLLFATATPLSAQVERLVNGDFETGDFITGWTVVDTGQGAFEVNNGTIVIGGLGATRAPIAGSFDAVTNGTGSGSHEILQQFTVPAGLTNATLSWVDQINNFATAGFQDPNQEFRVLIEDNAGNLITEVFSTNPGDQAIQPATNRSFDITSTLAPLSGQTLQVAFEEVDNLFFLNVFLDNCSLVT